MLWCGYDQSHGIEAMVVLATHIVPVLIIIVYCYFAIILEMRRTKLTLTQQLSFQASTAFRKDRKTIVRMTGFVVIFVITWFPYLISYVVSYSNPKSSFFQEQVFVSALAHSQGLSNLFLYVLNKQFISLLRLALVNRFPSLRSRFFPDLRIAVHSTDTSPAVTPASTPHATPFATPQSTPNSSSFLTPRNQS
eukprot:Phypoly_transcript_15559.p1 GENE.Phypoly_transcript_15559~~Phypoly_transcript_15559.p1  ORF type:complete len:193 (+),score=12.02 Phypoly_transcript_15559:145-723(+)